MNFRKYIPRKKIKNQIEKKKTFNKIARDLSIESQTLKSLFNSPIIAQSIQLTSY